jgi:threonine dehydrogenase-like Zn-dependent dehydrogenase
MSREVQAVLLDRSLDLRVGSRRLPEPGPAEALVRVEWAGLCGSDLHVMRTGAWVTEWPATLGHEIFGRIEAVGGDGALAPGVAVVADSRLPCGTCDACSIDPQTCSNLAFVGEACPGGFASHCVLPATSLHQVPETLDGATAVLAEPLAVVLHGLGRLPGAPARVAIIGHGPIGALVHVELRRRFPEVEIHVAEPAPLRAALSRALGADTFADADDLRVGAYDVVVDAAGFPSSLAVALARCAAGAQVLLLGLGEQPVPVRPMELVERRLTVTGSNAFVDELPAAIALLAAEGWRYEPVVTDAISLEELPAAARRQLARPDAVKVLVRP